MSPQHRTFSVSVHHLPWKKWWQRPHWLLHLEGSQKHTCIKVVKGALPVPTVSQKKRLFPRSADLQRPRLAKQTVCWCKEHTQKERKSWTFKQWPKHRNPVSEAKHTTAHPALHRVELHLHSYEDLPHWHPSVLAWNQSKGLENNFPHVNLRSVSSHSIPYNKHRVSPKAVGWLDEARAVSTEHKQNQEHLTPPHTSKVCLLCKRTVILPSNPAAN